MGVQVLRKMAERFFSSSDKMAEFPLCQAPGRGLGRFWGEGAQ